MGNDLAFSMRKGTGSPSGSMTDIDVASNVLMRLNGDGKLVIGKSGLNGTLTKWEGSYKLFVEDGILTEKVRVAVKTSSDWADYVFDENYKVMPLPQLEAYVQQNKHLPGVPSAQDVVNNGVDLQKMDATLLQKVEELTLIVIQQQKELDKLKKKPKNSGRG